LKQSNLTDSFSKEKRRDDCASRLFSYEMLLFESRAEHGSQKEAHPDFASGAGYARATRKIWMSALNEECISGMLLQKATYPTLSF
jgi:hypothetical protein